jgi:Mg/Co/Ni transporter MgtE (contains CBS domain)
MSPIIEVLKETIKRAISKRDYKTIEKIIIKTHKGDIAEVFKYLKKEERKILMLTLIKLNIQKAANVFQDLEEDIKSELLRNLSSKDLTNLLNNLPVNEIVKIIDHIPYDVRDIILKNLEKEKIEELEELEQLLTTNEDNIASIIREDYLSINENITVQEALEIVKNADKEIEILYIYVVDDKNRLIGVVSLKELITYPGNILVKDIMTRELITVSINATKEEVIDVFKRYDLYILPVINDEESL